MLFWQNLKKLNHHRMKNRKDKKKMQNTGLEKQLLHFDVIN